VYSCFVLFALSFVAFVVIRLIPGDPARLIAGLQAAQEDVDRIRQEWGLDKPFILQYWKFLENVIHGNMGISLSYHAPVAGLLARRLKNTFTLAVPGFLVAASFGIFSGWLSAFKRNTAVDYVCISFAVLGVSVPGFWLGLMLIWLFGVKLGWFPTYGMGTWRHMVIPVVTIGLTYAAGTARLVRTSMLDVLYSDYIRTARAKGLPERAVMAKHALRNALIPTVTLLGLMLGGMIGGLAVLETVFSWPGLGKLLVDSVRCRDYPVLQGVILVMAAGVTLVNLMVDLLYGVLDPRIVYE